MTDTATATEPKLWGRVRALLAQAEHPNTDPAEAAAFSAKAAELMTRYQIEEAALHARRDRSRPTVTNRTVGLPKNYSRQRAQLLGDVAAHFDCSLVTTCRGRSYLSATVYGTAHDLDSVEMLYTSLLLQSTRELNQASPPRLDVHTATWKRSWLTGYVLGVRERFAGAKRVATHGVDPGTALVLADKKAQAEAVMRAEHPGLGESSTNRVSGIGINAGKAAGHRADLGGDRIGHHRARQAIT